MVRGRWTVLGSALVIRGYIALRRQLRAFAELCNISWSDVIERHERDDDGRIFRNDDRAEIAFRCNRKSIELAIFAPSTDKDHRPDGKNVLPLGKIAARIDGEVIGGPLDQKTWDDIKREIHK